MCLWSLLGCYEYEHIYKEVPSVVMPWLNLSGRISFIVPFYVAHTEMSLMRSCTKSLLSRIYKMDFCGEVPGSEKCFV